MDHRYVWILATALLLSGWGKPVRLAFAQMPPQGGQVTQAELAQMLVQATGLIRFLPVPATPLDYFKVLAENGVLPAGGWQATKIVNKADLARVIVQALGDTDQIDHPEDPVAYVDYLESIGKPIETVGQTVQGVPLNPEFTAAYVFAAGLTTDPLIRQQVFGEPDEPHFGVDITSPSSVRPVTSLPPAEPPPVMQPPPSAPPVVVPPPPLDPPNVTPDGGEGSPSNDAIQSGIVSGLIDLLNGYQRGQPQ